MLLATITEKLAAIHTVPRGPNLVPRTTYHQFSVEFHFKYDKL